MNRPLKKHLDMDYDEALEKVPAALAEEGFGVLTEIDVKATLEKKLDVDFRRYKILGACNPPLAHRALSSDVEVGLLLPCNVIVYEEGEGRTIVHALDPHEMLHIHDKPDLREIAIEARGKLERAIGRL